MKYLITGKNGQLATSFVQQFGARCIECVAPDERELDITDFRALSSVIAAVKPDIIINCAAYNLVDKAEETPATAFAVNAEGPRNLARAAAQHGTFLVHFGSDYVFDGSKESGLYTEEDSVNPLNEYGKSKLAGEQHVLDELGSRSLILRLSWVFGPGKQNFIFKLRQWAASQDFLRIACDEFSVPTSTDTVVELTLRALEQGLTGRYHLTNSGYCSRYEWAKLILQTAGIHKFIRPVSMDSFNLPAKRPKFSAMSNEKIVNLLNIAVVPWEEAVVSFWRKAGADR